MRKTAIAIVVILMLTITTTATAAQSMDIPAMLEDLRHRIETIELRLALTQLPAYTMEVGENGYSQTGQGNWVGNITINEPQIRAFQVTFNSSDGFQHLVKLNEIGGGNTITIFEEFGRETAIGGTVLAFGMPGGLPLGEYAINVQTASNWEILIPGN